MAYCDTKNKKIVGCEKGTFAYFHEEGHLVYNESAEGIRKGYNMQMFFYLAVTFTIFSVFVPRIILLSFFSIMMFWYYFMYEERWCDNYAKEKMK